MGTEEPDNDVASKNALDTEVDKDGRAGGLWDTHLGESDIGPQIELLIKLVNTVRDCHTRARSAAEDVLDSVSAESLLQASSVTELSDAARRLNEAVTAATTLASALKIEVEVAPPLTVALTEVLVVAQHRAAEIGLAQAERERREAVHKQIVALAANFSVLLRVQGPAVYSAEIDALRKAAAPPADENAVPAWLANAPALTELASFLDHGLALDAAACQRVAQASSPVVLGLALSGQLWAEESRPTPPLESVNVENPSPSTKDGPQKARFDTLPLQVKRDSGLDFLTSTVAADRVRSGGAVEVRPSDDNIGSSSLTESPKEESRYHLEGVEEASSLLSGDAIRDSSVGDEASQSDGGPPLKESLTSDEETTPDFVDVVVQAPSSKSSAAPKAPSIEALVDDVGGQTGPPEPDWGALQQLLSDGHLGGAAWAARATSRGWGTALEALAVADALRSDTGPLTKALWRVVQDISVGDEGSELVPLAAALCLAACVSPYSGATDVLDQIHDRLSAMPLRDLARKIVQSARQGFLLSSAPDANLGSLAGGVEELRASAAILLSSAPARNLKFHRATRVYQHWMSQEGLLGALLTAVSDDDRHALERVREGVRPLFDERTLERLIDETDARLRPPNATAAIIADPRQRLLDLAREAAQVADDWVKASSRLSGPGIASEDHRTELLETADAALQVTADGLAVGEFALAQTATKLALTSLRQRLREGFSENSELVIEDVLDRFLPFVYEVRLTRQDWNTLTPAAHAALLAAPYRTPQDAYAGFQAASDHVGSARLIGAVAAVDPDMAARLSERREHDVRAARAAVTRRLDTVRSSFDQLESFPGLLSEATAVALRGLLIDAAGGHDLLAARRGLDRAEALLHEARTREAETLRKLANDLGVNGADRKALQRLLDQGSLSAAHERLDAVRAGGIGATDARGAMDELQRRFWTRCIDAASSQTVLSEAVETLNRGGGLEPFGSGPTEIQQGALRATALNAWTELFRSRRAGDLEGRLRAVLAVIGLQGPTPRKDQERVLGTHMPVNLQNAQPVLPVISYELGSAAAGRYRLLVVWDEMTADRLVSLAVTDARPGPHLILYRSALSRQQREALAAATRAQEAAQRRIIVIDPAVMLTMAFQAEPTFGILEHLTLPFGRTSPFNPDVAGNVPPELFRGRRRELDEILNPHGTNFVYGGRQVGKSALLRAAVREVESAQDPDRRAVYLDVKALGLGLWRDAAELWLELLDELRRNNVVTDRTSRSARGDATIAHLRSWLDADASRRLLVCLDECDELLDIDAKHNFAIVERLRGLMSSSDRRFKVVLAGLHQVQRFERQRNVPLAHLTQQPINVGPLQPGDALELLLSPLSVHGYHLDEDAAWRVLSHTNYQPGLIQVFGQALLRALHTENRFDGLPTRVDHAFVDHVYADDDLAQHMRRRFMLTIHLDDRYRCIAYVIALRNLQEGMAASYDDAELLDTSSFWWPAGFESLRPALFRGLVEEMIGLGVLVRIDDQLRIRNPNVVRLLGNRGDIEAELLDFEAIQPPKTFEPSLYRRAVPGGGRSPLTEEELAAAVEVDAPGLVIIGGSVALGLDRVAAAVQNKLIGREDVAFASVPFDELAQRLSSASARTVLIADASSLVVAEALATAREVQEVVDSFSRGTAMRRAVLILGPRALAVWDDGAPAPAGLSSTVRIGLRRLTADALEAWSGEESLELDRSARSILLAATGGWPLLVERTVAARAVRGSWEGAADITLMAALEEDDTFLSSVLGEITEIETVARLLVELDEPVSWELLEDFSEGSVDSSARDAVRALQLTDSFGDGLFQLEPLLFRVLAARESR